METLFELASEAPVHLDPENTRIHDKRNKESINKSLTELGPGRSVCVDENGKLLAGNGTYEEAVKLGKKVLIVEGDRDTLVVVQRKDLTEVEKIRMSLWDNHASDLSRNDNDAIKRIAVSHPKQTILEGIFSPKDQSKILREHENAQELAEGGAADAPGLLPNSNVLPESGTRMIQIFLESDNVTSFQRMVRQIGKTLFPNAKNNTEQIVEIVKKAHSEWLTAEQTMETEMEIPVQQEATVA